jgi:hypothetical protein
MRGRRQSVEWLQGQELEPPGRSGAPASAGHDPASFDAVIQRIQDLKGLDSQAAVARFLGISRQNLHECRKRGSLPSNRLEKFADEEGVSLQWVLRGEDAET